MGISVPPSVTTGNGLSGTGTVASPIVDAAPALNSIGSYAMVYFTGGSTVTYGNSYACGTSPGQLQLAAFYDVGGGILAITTASGVITGTWKWLGSSVPNVGTGIVGIAVKVS
jgi:hypothetical protein